MERHRHPYNEQMLSQWIYVSGIKTRFNNIICADEVWSLLWRQFNGANGNDNIFCTLYWQLSFKTKVASDAFLAKIVEKNVTLVRKCEPNAKWVGQTLTRIQNEENIQSYIWCVYTPRESLWTFSWVVILFFVVFMSENSIKIYLNFSSGRVKITHVGYIQTGWLQSVGK